MRRHGTHTLRIIAMGLPALLLGACDSGVDWQEVATEACSADYTEAQCTCMVDGLTEQFDGDEESQMLAAFFASLDGSQVTDEQLEALDMSAAEFAGYREENERTISRLRRSCTEG
ncbi:MAG: hypothetical protein H6843_04990 [Rhodospirillaceae bacterium]|nr:hypothetical protein [Rhodospirillaceae bacterium]